MFRSPEETNAAYGFAKRLLLVQSKAYRDQYGFNSVCLLLGNMYGPRDNFDLRTSHVIPALIRKCLLAKQTGEDVIPVWGTGSASRDFLFVRDAAEGVVATADRYNGHQPVNLGSLVVTQRGYLPRLDSLHQQVVSDAPLVKRP